MVVINKKNQTKNYPELIEAVNGGDQKATTELYQIINSFCKNIIRQKKYGICIESLGVLSHDITSEILLKKLKYYTSEKAFLPWLYRIISNKIIDEFRREKTSIFGSNNQVELSENTFSFFTQNVNEFDKYFLDEKNNKLRTAIDQLSAHKKRIILMYYFEGFSVKEIAENTGRSNTSITMLLHRTRAKLKTTLQQYQAFQG